MARIPVSVIETLDETATEQEVADMMAMYEADRMRDLEESLAKLRQEQARRIASLSNDARKEAHIEAATAYGDFWQAVYQAIEVRRGR